jgi:glutamate racemase
MNMFKPFFPLAFVPKKDVIALVINIVLHIVADAIAGLVIAGLGGLPLIGWAFSLVGSVIGLLATEGTVASGVFQDYLEAKGLRVMEPASDDQAVVSSLIYDGVKAGGDYDPGQLVMLAERLRARGCDAVIVGCTELSVIYQGLSQRPDWLYDSLDILADRCVEIYQHAREMGVLPQM